MENVIAESVVGRCNHLGKAGQELVVLVRHLAATAAPLVKVAQLNAQNAGLELIQAAVPPLFLTEILFNAAVGAQRDQVTVNLFAVGHDHPAIAVAPEILAGEKADAA